MQEEDSQSSKDETMEQLKALGYIDPGAGSSMWQVMLAGFFRATHRVKSVFRNTSRYSEDQED